MFSNKIYKVDKNGKRRRIFWVKGLKIKFKGKNAVVLLHEPIAKFKKSLLVCGNNSFVEIGTSKYKSCGLEILARGENSHCKIGQNFSCTDGCMILLHLEPDLSVKIGDECMFGTNVLLRTSDGHAVYSTETGEVINSGKSIEIGNHCWLAMNVSVLKGVKIADNSIIGTDSLVTKNCEISNSIYIGTPAKMIKTNVNWDRKNPAIFKKD